MELSPSSNVRSRVVALFVCTIVVGASLAFTPTMASAQSCDGDTNIYARCGEELRSGLRNTLRYGGSDYDDTFKRAESVRDALKNCINCALDHVGDRINNFNSNGYSTRSGSRGAGR